MENNGIGKKISMIGTSLIESHNLIVTNNKICSARQYTNKSSRENHGQGASYIPYFQKFRDASGLLCSISESLT